MIILKYSLPILCLLLTGCSFLSSHKEEKESIPLVEYEHTPENIQPCEECSTVSPPERSEMALYMDSLGLINIADLDSSLVVKLMYTQADNFTGEVLYDNLTEAYLHPDAAYALIEAQKVLKRLHPSYSLIIYDAARPMSVQKKMWNVVKGTSKYIYVSNPSRGGGLHNYGLAVDISILDDKGTPLPMGTPVDHLGREAHITEEAVLVAQGKLTEQERENRLLLRQVMKEAGFHPLPSEWWHFNRVSRQTAKERYRVIP